MKIAIWTNTFDNLNKYSQQIEQIHLTIWTNTFDSLDIYILWRLKQQRWKGKKNAIWTNTFSKLNKYIWQFSRIYFAEVERCYKSVFFHFQEVLSCWNKQAYQDLVKRMPQSSKEKVFPPSSWPFDNFWFSPTFVILRSYWYYFATTGHLPTG